MISATSVARGIEKHHGHPWLEQLCYIALKFKMEKIFIPVIKLWSQILSHLTGPSSKD